MSERPAEKSARMASSVLSSMLNEPDWASPSIERRTLAASRPDASNSSRSKLDDTWMSIDGDVVAITPRVS